MQLLLLEDQQVVQALSSHTAHKAFTDRIRSWRMIRRFKYLDIAGCCHMSETGPKLAITITDEILRRVSIRSRLPQLLRGPSVGRRSCHTHVDHFPRSQFNDEEGKERTEEVVSHLEEITGPHFSSMIAEESPPVLSP